MGGGYVSTVASENPALSFGKVVTSITSSIKMALLPGEGSLTIPRRSDDGFVCTQRWYQDEAFGVDLFLLIEDFGVPSHSYTNDSELGGLEPE